MNANNIYLIDKPQGVTSFDVIRQMRKKLGIRRLGHAGTLDPFATGVLIVAAGRFTRISDYFHRYEKVYRAMFQLGVRTDTDDMTGTVLSQSDVENLKLKDVERVLKNMVGRIEQRPPAISAKRVDGKRLHEVNRAGVTVQPRPATVTIHDITVQSMDNGAVDLEIVCGSGTYIRSIARDLGEELGVGGSVRRLNRIRIGPYSLDRCSDPGCDPVPMEHLEILPDWDAYVLGSDQMRELKHGRPVRLRDVEHRDGEMVRVFSPYFSQLIALGRIESKAGEDPRIFPEKVFFGG